MRFFILLMLCSLCLFIFPTIGQSQGMLYPSARNAILMEQETGRILYEKSAFEKRPIASITKIMTALVAIQYGNLTDEVKVSKRILETYGSSIYLQVNEEMNLEDLLYGLMLRSGNDASIAIAEHVGGSVEGFVFLMNQIAENIGMENSHFMNPHGLDEEGHYSTAYDMALLMRYAMGNDTFQKISGTRAHKAKTREYPWHNKNRLLNYLYEPCTGGKTGFTKSAGRTLVTTAQKEQLSLIAVTLNAPKDWKDHMMMYEWGFENYMLKRLDEEGKRTFRTAGESVNGFIDRDVFYPLQREEESDVRKEITLVDSTDPLSGQIGTIRYFFQSDLIGEIPVYRKKQMKWMNEMTSMVLDLLQVDRRG